jgi:hypothetical protein
VACPPGLDPGFVGISTVLREAALKDDSGRVVLENLISEGNALLNRASCAGWPELFAFRTGFHRYRRVFHTLPPEEASEIKAFSFIRYLDYDDNIEVNSSEFRTTSDELERRGNQFLRINSIQNPEGAHSFEDAQEMTSQELRIQCEHLGIHGITVARFWDQSAIPQFANLSTLQSIAPTGRCGPFIPRSTRP